MASFRIEAILSEKTSKVASEVMTDLDNNAVDTNAMRNDATNKELSREDVDDVCVDDVTSCSDSDEQDDVSTLTQDKDDVTHPLLSNGQHPAFRFNPLLDQRHLTHLQALAGGVQVPPVILNSAFRSPHLEFAQRQAWMQRMHMEWLVARGGAPTTAAADLHSKSS